MRLRNSSPNTVDRIHAIRGVYVTNYLYEMDVFSAYKEAKGFNRPLEPSSLPKPLDPGLLDALQNLIARRKLTRILCLHSYKPSDFHLGDLI